MWGGGLYPDQGQAGGWLKRPVFHPYRRDSPPPRTPHSALSFQGLAPAPPPQHAVPPASCAPKCRERRRKAGGLTCGEPGVRVGPIPSGGRSAVPHGVLVGRQVAHVAVAVAPHGGVGELGDAGSCHVVGSGDRPVVAHGVLLHGRLSHLRLPVGGQRSPQVAALHAHFLVAFLQGAQDVRH